METERTTACSLFFKTSGGTSVTPGVVGRHEYRVTTAAALGVDPHFEDLDSQHEDEERNRCLKRERTELRGTDHTHRGGENGLLSTRSVCNRGWRHRM